MWASNDRQTGHKQPRVGANQMSACKYDGRMLGYQTGNYHTYSVLS